MKENMNINEVSLYLNISISKVRSLVRGKMIPFFRIGNRLYFNKQSITLWLEELEKKEKPIGFIY